MMHAFFISLLFLVNAQLPFNRDIRKSVTLEARIDTVASPPKHRTLEARIDTVASPPKHRTLEARIDHVASHIHEAPSDPPANNNAQNVENVDAFVATITREFEDDFAQAVGDMVVTLVEWKRKNRRSNDDSGPTRVTPERMRVLMAAVYQAADEKMTQFRTEDAVQQQ